MITSTMELKSNDWQLAPFVKADAANPCLEPETGYSFACPMRGEDVRWEEKDVFNPAAVVRNGKVYLLYRAEDKVGKHAGTSRIGLAESEDGFVFSKRPEPVLFPDRDGYEPLEWEGGCEDPRIAEDEAGTYYLTYTSYDGRIARLCVATSPDLVHWTKHGSVFGKAENGKYADLWSKAGSIVTRREGDRFIAAKINGKYWMYWGESHIFAATSDDLVQWEPVVKDFRLVANSNPVLVPVLMARKNRFDSELIEPGPQAVITERGILLIYNSKNAVTQGDSSHEVGAYCAGQVLLDIADPTAVIARTEEPFLVPDKDYEIGGQTNHVCFVEGLVHHRGQWLLYYGTADSKIAIAYLSIEDDLSII